MAGLVVMAVGPRADRRRGALALRRWRIVRGMRPPRPQASSSIAFIGEGVVTTVRHGDVLNARGARRTPEMPA